MRLSKKLTVIVLAALFIISAVIGFGFADSKSVAAADGEFTRTAIEIAKDMGYGWNLGNTMEAINTWTYNPTVKDFETAWGQPVTTKAMITGVKNAGFDSIRIPVAWSNMISSDGNYTIDSAYFDRVEEIIGYAMDNDMYVIINIHWDGGWWDNFKTNKTESMKRYKTMWTQIATRYKDYPEKLIFESANEELGDNMGYSTVNEVNQAFVDVVRATGGNNGKRYLLIAGYNTDIDKTCSSSYKMPDDVISDHLMVSVHYYTPWIYVALYKDEGYGYKSTWGTTSDKEEMEKYLKKMTKFTDAGYGVVIGEYSVLPQYISSGNYNRKDGDVTYITYLLQLCDEYGYAPYLWDAGDWYDRSTCKMRWADIAAVYADLATPKLNTPSNTATGIKVSWNSVSGAQKYYVYRKTATGWDRIVTTTSTSYTDTNVKNNTSYTYTVKAVRGSDVSGYDKTGKTIKYVSAPQLTSAADFSSGINVKWSKVTGADKYILYRKSSGTGWSRISEVTGTSYTDTTVKAGTEYTYTVRACIGSYTSWYDSMGIKYKFISKPGLTGISNSSAGTKISWSKSAGATGYYVYRKTGTQDWKRIATTTGLTYTDKTAAAGTTYTYTVRGYNGSYRSAYDDTGKTIKRLTNPVLSSVSNAATGVTVNWGKVTGASGYYVYRKTSGESWTRIATINSGSTVSYTDTKATNGVTYIYTVKAYSGNYTSSYNATGKTIVRLARPTISSVTNSAVGKMTVKWNQNIKATGYQVYYKTGSTVKIVTVSGNTNIRKVIESLTKGKSYTVYVRSYRKVGSTTYYSAWSSSKTIKISK